MVEARARRDAPSSGLSPDALASLYRDASNMMRGLDGLQPQEAFDELLKYLVVLQGDDPEVRRGDGAVGAIRSAFVRHLRRRGGGARELWSDEKIRLSDAALARLDALFAGVELAALDFDVRAAALRAFLGPEVRRGLGIFLTPDSLVRAIVTAASPPAGARVYDPACGAGTFLMATLRHFREQGAPGDLPAEVFGSDINARMLTIAELNLGHLRGARFHARVMDALDPRPPGEFPAPGQFDYIFTNPPFGVYVDLASSAGAPFLIRRDGASARIQAEVLFIEQCLRWLRPGGLLGIVVPRSVLTNDVLAGARGVIDSMAALVGVIHLPPEAFSATGTRATTSALFLRRRPAGPGARAAHVDVPVVDVDNVGYDGTGRARSGDQLAAAAADLRDSMRTGRAAGMARSLRLPAESPLASLSRAPGPAILPGAGRAARLGDIVSLAETGRTPARAGYADGGGLFVVKVGNLTGQGIDWYPRDRNFVSPTPAFQKLLLAPGDLLLTSCAHHRRYIAQKVDIVQSIPAFIGGQASFVAEMIRLRVQPGEVDPFELLAFLRSPGARAAIQDRVSGQTAHLRPRDLLELPLPPRLAAPELVALLRRESELSRELNEIAHRQREILGGAPDPGG